MHEFSIVTALLDMVAADARSHQARAVSGIVVKIGTLSGVVPELFEEAFATCKRGTIAENARLEIIRQEIAIRCPCGYNGGIENLCFQCPACGRTAIEVTDGEEMILQRLELELDEP